MSNLLFPRLTEAVADGIWEVIKNDDVSALTGTSATFHVSAGYASTGGTRVDPSHLKHIRTAILQIAEQSGFPDAGSRESRAGFDVACGEWFYEHSLLPVGEALRKEVWSFQTLVLMPDISRWRFRGGGRERFLGGIRNVFQRLWLRAFLFGGETHSKRRGRLLAQLTEDAFVAITERPGLSSNPRVANAIATAWLKTADVVGVRKMEAIHRDAMKRLRELSPVVCLDVLTDESLDETVMSAFQPSTGEISEDTCKKCRGTGLSGSSLCPMCEGTGKNYLTRVGSDSARLCPHCEGAGLWKGKVCEVCGGYGEMVIG